MKGATEKALESVDHMSQQAHCEAIETLDGDVTPSSKGLDPSIPATNRYIFFLYCILYITDIVNLAGVDDLLVFNFQVCTFILKCVFL